MGEVPEWGMRLNDSTRLNVYLTASRPSSHGKARKARQWMLAPNAHLAGKTPRECLQSVAGRAQLRRYVRALEDSNVF